MKSLVDVLKGVAEAGAEGASPGMIVAQLAINVEDFAEMLAYACLSGEHCAKEHPEDLAMTIHLLASFIDAGQVCVANKFVTLLLLTVLLYSEIKKEVNDIDSGEEHLMKLVKDILNRKGGDNDENKN